MCAANGNRWRLILDGGASGARNMAIDEALLAHAEAGYVALGGGVESSRPHDPATEAPARSWSHTLRLYWFEPPALSIGALQPLAEVDRAACASAGIELVRRPSGGRAVLHAVCVTYAITGAADGAVFKDGIRPSYRRLALAIVTAIRLLGLGEVEPAEPSTSSGTSPSCFDHAAPYEPVVAGHKLAGSAQARRGRVALQHGSLRLAPGSAQTALLLSVRAGARGAMPGPDPLSLSELVGRPVCREEAVKALVEGFRAAFDVDLWLGALSAEEEALAARLEVEKYRAASWTERA